MKNSIEFYEIRFKPRIHTILTTHLSRDGGEGIIFKTVSQITKELD
jgi:hypothetical protein